jgi:ABC-type uncharacterized transport system permease subunit
MKTRTLSAIFMIAGSVCYIISIAVVLRTGEASGYRLYLNVILGLIFFALAWNSYFKNRPKKDTQTNK